MMVSYISTELIYEISSNLEEPDLRVVLYIRYIENSMSHIKRLRVKAKDSGIIFISLYCSKSLTVDIIIDTGEKLRMNDNGHEYDKKL